MRRGERSAKDSDRSQGVEPPEYHGGENFRSRQHFYRDFLERSERAEGTRHQLAKIIAGDVFDDLAACLKDFATPADAAKAEKMIACGARFDAARPRKVAGQYAAQGTPANDSCRRAEERAQIWRLESEH